MPQQREMKQDRLENRSRKDFVWPGEYQREV
jgi:hypothetical protein